MTIVEVLDSGTMAQWESMSGTAAWAGYILGVLFLCAYAIPMPGERRTLLLLWVGLVLIAIAFLSTLLWAWTSAG